MKNTQTFTLVGMCMLIGMLSCQSVGVVNTDDAKENRPHVVFIAADSEYRSEEILPMLGRILRERHGFRVTVLFAVGDDGFIDPNALDNIPGLEVLEEADLLVMYAAFRTLPDDQLEHIRRYADSGRPLVGFRTSTISFRYPQGHRHHHMNAQWSHRVFGQHWINHHGNANSTDVAFIDAMKDHPVLRGVEPFHGRSWLYHVDPLHDNARPVLIGRAVRGAEPGGEHFGEPHSVAWLHTHEAEHGDARVFFTTLGHPFEFKHESMRRLSINGIYWALGMEDQIPAEGFNVDYVGDYDPNDAGFGQVYKQNLRPDDVFVNQP